MRLIDADALIKRFEGLRDEHETLAISYVALCEVLVATPTAYDVDTVVAELKKESYQEWCDSPRIVELKDAIEIVRNAGKEVGK